MKLSELTTEQAADVLCELTPHIANIVSDEELIAEIKNKMKATAETTMAEIVEFALQKLNKIIPIILKKRKNDFFGILGVLNDKTPEEIAKQNFITTANQVREMVKDKDLLDFFKSCTGSEGSE